MTSINIPDYQNEKSDQASFLQQLDHIRVNSQKSLDKALQSDLGQFFTPPSIALMMARMFARLPSSIHLVDPGAGVGTLSAAFVSNAVFQNPLPERIYITAFELDNNLVNGLNSTFIACKQLCNQHRINFQYEIRQEDFISSSVETLLGRYSLFPVDQPNYNCAILNPPYKKINSNSKTRHLLKSVDIETTNLYTAFVWLIMKLLLPESEMVAITPRSFCNGTYFRPFRQALLRTMAIKRIHIFGSRDKAFEEGEVLQENIILHAEKTNNAQGKITITSNEHSDDDVVVQEIEPDQFVYPNDPDLFLRIVPDQLGHQINNQMRGLTTSLKDLNITVSTGRVVDFRAKKIIRSSPDREIIPLLYPGNFRDGYILWPQTNIKKPYYLSSSAETDSVVIPAQYYVLVKRFSSKEEKRRVYAAVYDPRKIPAKRIGIENHINYFYRRYGELAVDLAKGLALYLNSTLVDQYFRQFSGHTQVNATDLRNLKYPTESQLNSLGGRVNEHFPDQDEIDKIITEELALDKNAGDANSQDPIQAKKRIKEALTILQMLNVPRAQQNDRSALTLLALSDIKANIPWTRASQNLIGITEMMDFFRENYGINYAPNTRETVRRQTVHQFLQLGLISANPDDPSRPINSPKTRYILETRTVELIRPFGSPEWQSNFKDFIQGSTSLSALRVKERVMPMIPVVLPGGDQIMLSSGGQNELIKNIIEEFCPRFTPGGKVVYIGDAGEKLNEKELEYFENLGIKIDKHGKMPDVIIDLPDKKWLVLIEAVTSHGPIDIKRHNELKSIFGKGEYGLVFVTAFETRKAMHKFLSAIAWETEVWISEAPSHLIHFNGERFLGPYPNL